MEILFRFRRLSGKGWTRLMKRAYNKDILRTIKYGRKRFLSLAFITVLGVTMMCGLKAACVDLRRSADEFFDGQQLFDITVMSTLGLTDEDVSVLSEMDGIELAEGIFSATVYTENDGRRHSAQMNALSETGINTPYVVEGKLPENSGEIAVTEKYIKDTDRKIGDTIYVKESDETDYFPNTAYRITAVVIDAADVNNPNGSVAFRASSSTDYTFFTQPQEEYEDKVYTAIYLLVSESRELFCFSDEYDERIGSVLQSIETQIQEKQEKSRSESVLKEAYAKLADAENEAHTQLAEAQEELIKAQQELEDSKAQLDKEEQSLTEKEQLAKKEFAAAWQEIGQGYQSIDEAAAQLETSEKELEAGEAKLHEAKQEFAVKETEANAQLEAAGSELEKKRTELNGTKEQLNLALQQPNLSDEEKQQLEMQLVQVNAGLQELGSQTVQFEEKKKETLEGLEAARQELANQENVLKESREKLEAGKAELETNRSTLEKNAMQLMETESETENQIKTGREQIHEAREKLLEGEDDLEAGRREYDEKRAEAEEELQKARREVAEIDMAQWYVQDRTSLSGYSNIESDASCIEAIGTAFPILFLTVAILISLTTITRMVEEDRGLIGTYKALGFTNGEILYKYLAYAFGACLLGGVIGDIGGFVVLPEIIFIIFATMYQLPVYKLSFDVVYGIGGILLFMAGIVGATIIACYAELRQKPAELMRPKAPRLGSRVILERITFLWNHFSFLNKVTARNLFRYKKRLFMTVAGIMGCTALLLCGFTIKDTVTELMPGQYERIYQYDLMAAAAADDNDELLALMEQRDEISQYLNILVETVKVKNAPGEEQKIQMIVVPEIESLRDYITLEDMDGNSVELNDSGVFLTNNAMDVLDVREGENVFIQNLKLVQKELHIEKQVLNYLGNTVYMTQAVYEKFFGEYKPNGVLAKLSDNCTNQREFAEELGREECVISSVSTQELKQDFSKAFTLINMVVYIIIILAAALAFVVLFTLSTTNISERERELATIKVLGFYDREVHLYVNKETIILTLVGILFGLPLGVAFGGYLMYILKFPSIYFAVTIYPVSFFIAAGIALMFALMVDFITDRALDKINPVEALKSIE